MTLKVNTNRLVNCPVVLEVFRVVNGLVLRLGPTRLREGSQGLVAEDVVDLLDQLHQAVEGFLVETRRFAGGNPLLHSDVDLVLGPVPAAIGDLLVQFRRHDRHVERAHVLQVELRQIEPLNGNRLAQSRQVEDGYHSVGDLDYSGAHPETPCWFAWPLCSPGRRVPGGFAGTHRQDEGQCADRHDHRPPVWPGARFFDANAIMVRSPCRFPWYGSAASCGTHRSSAQSKPTSPLLWSQPRQPSAAKISSSRSANPRSAPNKSPSPSTNAQRSRAL